MVEGTIELDVAHDEGGKPIRQLYVDAAALVAAHVLQDRRGRVFAGEFLCGGRFLISTGIDGRVSVTSHDCRALLSDSSEYDHAVLTLTAK